MTSVGKRNHRVLDLADAPERLVADAHRPSCLRLTCPADCRQCGSRPGGLSLCSEAGAQGDDVNATSTQDVRLPQQGLSRETIREELRRAARGDLEPVPAMAAGVQYPAGDDVLEVASDAYLSFFSTNGLLPSIFPSLARFEHDVISMTAGILHGDRAVGSITSGGSESILMGVKSARDRGRELHPDVSEPEMVLPESAGPGAARRRPAGRRRCVSPRHDPERGAAGRLGAEPDAWHGRSDRGAGTAGGRAGDQLPCRRLRRWLLPALRGAAWLSGPMSMS